MPFLILVAILPVAAVASHGVPTTLATKNISSARKFGVVLNDSAPLGEVGSCALYGCHVAYRSEQSCQCDVNCHDFGNCCKDNDDICFNVAVKAILGSCAHYGCRANYRPEQNCQCNVKCHDFGNCCPDFEDVCLGSCQVLGCVGQYDPWKSCQCSPSCQTYQNCCNDYEEICNSPPAPTPHPPAPRVAPPAPEVRTKPSTNRQAPRLITSTKAPLPITSTQEHRPTDEHPSQTNLRQSERSADEQSQIDEANLQIAVVGLVMLVCFVCSGICCAIGGMLQEFKTAKRNSDFYCRTVKDKSKANVFN